MSLYRYGVHLLANPLAFSPALLFERSFSHHNTFLSEKSDNPLGMWCCRCVVTLFIDI